jgi:hypothetical protein
VRFPKHLVGGWPLSPKAPTGVPHLLSLWYLQTLYDPPDCWSGAKTHGK